MNPIVRMVLPKSKLNNTGEEVSLKSRLNIPVRRTAVKDPSAMVKNAKTLLTRAMIGRVSPKCQSTERRGIRAGRTKSPVVVSPKLQSTEEEGAEMAMSLVKVVVDSPKLQSTERRGMVAKRTMSRKEPVVVSPKLQSTSNNDKVHEDRNDGAWQ